MKILFINRWVGYNEGGNETHIKDLMVEFDKRDHQVSIMTTNGTALSSLPKSIKKIWINHRQGYYTYSFIGPIYGLIFIVQCFWKYVSLYSQGMRYDVISVHFSLEAFLARFIKLFFGTPYVLVMAGDTPLEIIEGKRADEKVHISKTMNETSKRYGYSAQIIPKGIDIQRFNQHTKYSQLKKRYKLTNKKIILTVCRFDPRKDLLTLIEAINILITKYKIKNYYFILIGDGVERPKIEQKIKDYNLRKYIDLVGSLSNSDPVLPKFYALADIFVLPTLYEGFGWVYLEAMACGLPIITTKVGSNSEIIGKTGILIAPQKPLLLAKTIFNTLNDPQQLKTMKKKGILKATTYSWKKIGDEYEKLYSRVSQKKCEELSCKLSVIKDLLSDSLYIISHVFHFKR